MSDSENFKKYLGKEKYHQDFLVFFEKEMEKKGWENVVNEYVFAGDARADDMLVRMYAGKNPSYAYKSRYVNDVERLPSSTNSSGFWY